MKKRLAFALAAVLLLALAVPGYAAENSPASQGKVAWLPSVDAYGGGIETALYIQEFDQFAFLVSGRGPFIVDRATGKAVTPDGYVYIQGPFSDGLAPVANPDADGYYKWGFIDTTGQVVVPLEYDYTWPFSDGFATVAMLDADENLQYNIIDTTGQTVPLPEYDSIGSFSEGLVSVAMLDAAGNRKWGFIDTDGQVVVPLEYDRVDKFSKGLVKVAKDDADGNHKYGLIDTAGQVVLPPEYDNCGLVDDGTGGPPRFLFVVKGVSLGIYELPAND